MMYRYTGYTSDKRVVHGTIESQDMDVAEASLYKAGFVRILELKTQGSKIDIKKILFGGRGVSRQALLDFTLELEVLIASGLTLLAALKQLEKLSSENSMREVVSKLVVALQAGAPFHQALSAHPQVFSETYCSVMEANERAGTLKSGLRQIGNELKQQIVIRSQIQKATTEPIIIMALAICVIFLLTLYALPPLVDIFKRFGGQLPWTTSLLIGFSDFVNNNKWNLMVIIPVGIILVLLLLRQRSTKIVIDRYVLRVPVFGQLIIWHNTARFTRTLGNLLGAGILLPDAMGVILRNVSNTYFRDALTEARKRLVQGQSLSSIMSRDKIFPLLLVEMLGVGESTGNLESSLSTVANYFEAKVEKRIQGLTALLEPALLMGIGLVVGFVAVSLISTIYGMVGTLK